MAPLAEEQYPDTALLQQIPGGGPLTALGRGVSPRFDRAIAA
jgi:hypothetical protein